MAASPRTTAGFAIGVIAIRLDYPKVPGNVVNAATFTFPVLYEEVVFEIERLIVQNLGDRAAFAPIRWGATELDNGALIDDLVTLARAHVEKHPEIGATLLECSDLPPYAADIRDATGLPVFDFITLIDWVHHAVTQRRYYGDM